MPPTEIVGISQWSNDLVVLAEGGIAVSVGWSASLLCHGGVATWMERCGARMEHEDAAELVDTIWAGV